VVEAEVEMLPVLHSVGVAVAECEGWAEALAVAELEVETPEVAEMEGEPLLEGLTEGLLVAETEALRVAPAEAEMPEVALLRALPVTLGEGVRVGEAEGLTDATGEAVIETLARELPVTEVESEGEGLALGEAVGEGEALPVPESEAPCSVLRCCCCCCCDAKPSPVVASETSPEAESKGKDSATLPEQGAPHWELHCRRR
jgi:hypothetical protein